VLAFVVVVLVAPLRVVYSGQFDLTEARATARVGLVFHIRPSLQDSKHVF